jgi:glycosyltransferase involved in cell wall biosynthesis
MIPGKGNCWLYVDLSERRRQLLLTMWVKYLPCSTNLSLYVVLGEAGFHEANNPVNVAISNRIDTKSMTPRISVITPSLNRGKYIEAAIQSILRQDYSAVEHIVVDGGSTDGTLDILARYPHINVVSEPDQGMYDALNKGLRLAQGEIIGFLNADDLYTDHVFQSVMEYFHDEMIDAVSGKAQIFEEEKDGTSKTILELSPPHPDKLVETAITGSTIFNAWFYRKSILDRVGGFDSQYKISGDADLILRLALMGMNYRALDSIHYLYRQHEDSLTFQLNSEKLLTIFRDHSLFIKKYLSSPELPYEFRSLLNVSYTNLCSALSRHYEGEGKGVWSFLWKVRASLDISSPLFKYLAF